MQIAGEALFDEENLAFLASLAVKFNLLAVLIRTRGTPPDGRKPLLYPLSLPPLELKDGSLL
jgi:hypothetical protein